MDEKCIAGRSSRASAADDLDFYPTPPWATRALLERLPGDLSKQTVWEPACGRGDMVRVLASRFKKVIATDIEPRGCGSQLDFLTCESGVKVDWIITNPPFNQAENFALRALRFHQVRNLALLVRTVWLHGGGRYERLFAPRPPSIVYLFCERPAMLRGRLERKATTTTDYAWVVWCDDYPPAPGPVVKWIPPGTRCALDSFGDYDDDAPGLLAGIEDDRRIVRAGCG